VLAAGAPLDLQGGVVDPEVGVEAVVDAVDEGVVVGFAGAHQVRGHRDLAGAQRPDVQVVQGGHAGLREQPFAHLRLVDAARHRIHRRAEGIAQQPERPGRDHHRDQQRHRRIQPGPAQPPHAGAGQHRRQRDRGIGDQVQERPAPVEVVGMAVAHQPGRAEVDRDAEGGDHHHRQPGDLGWGAEAADRLPAERAGERDQQQRIGQRREQGGPAPAVGMARGGRAPGEDRGPPRQRQPEHVAEVVHGVRQQRQRIGGEAVAGLQQRVGEVDQGHPRERAGAICVRVAMHGARVPGARRGHNHGPRWRAQLRPWTRVPTCSPRRIRSSTPGCAMSKIRSGSSASRHSANAAVSITCRLRASTSS